MRSRHGEVLAVCMVLWKHHASDVDSDVPAGSNAKTQKLIQRQQQAHVLDTFSELVYVAEDVSVLAVL